MMLFLYIHLAMLASSDIVRCRPAKIRKSSNFVVRQSAMLQVSDPLLSDDAVRHQLAVRHVKKVLFRVNRP
jgi:hypothetical protein